MKSSAAAIATLAVLAALAPSTVHSATVVVAKDCTQAERQAVNKLLEQDVNPFKACATKAKSDITTISTSRLCPIAECKLWLAYMADNAPNCVYDDTNYGVMFTAKSKDCTGGATGSVDSDADAGTTTPKPTTKAPVIKSSSAGSLPGDVVTTPKPTTKAPLRGGSSSGSKGGSKDVDSNTIEVPTATKDSSTIIEPAPTPKPTTKAPTTAATPKPTSAASPLNVNVASALCAVSLVVAAIAF